MNVALKTNRDPDKAKRLRAIKLVKQQGLSPTKAAQRLRISRASIYQYLRKFDEGGVQKLLAHVQPGRPKTHIPALVREHLTEIIEGEREVMRDGGMWHCGPSLRLSVYSAGAGDYPIWQINRWVRELKREMKLPLKTFRWRMTQ